MLNRLLPLQAYNLYSGWRTALWMLGLFIALKLVMGFNSIFNTASAAQGADRIPIDAMSMAEARTVLMFFALTMLGQLILALVALVILLRYRSLVPLAFLFLLAEQVARRLIVASWAVPRDGDASAAVYANYVFAGWLVLGLFLSLLPRRDRSADSSA
jgi:hypothetical protein